MGSTTILDILGSTITFGFLLLIVLRLNASASESAFGYNSNYLLQRNMVVLTVMLEDDLKHVGAGVNDANGGIQLADDDDLIFRAMLPGNNFISTVEWKLEPTGPTGIQNTNIHYLSRTVDGVKTMMNLGVTLFSLQYWSVYTANTLIPTPITFSGTPNTGNIGPVSVTIRLESPYRPPAEYLAKEDTSAYQMVWRQIRSVSRNNSVQFQ
jgi:hypothetical protein